MEWSEVNLVLAPADGKAYPSPWFLPALREVVGPVAARLAAAPYELRSWHFGYYTDEGPGPHIRLRCLWTGTEPARFAKLLTARAGVSVVSWYRGAHGIEGQTYSGEEDEYGPVWEPTYLLWAAQSQWALAVLCHHEDGTLPPGVGAAAPGVARHWERAVHVATNRLGLPYSDEIWLTLNLASGYLNTLSHLQPDPTWQLWAWTLAQFTDTVADQVEARLPLNAMITEAPDA